MATTFTCPFCGAPITGPAPGVAFACPYCRAKVMAPSGGESPQRWDGGASESASSGPFSNGMYSVQVTVDAQLGPVAIGSYAPHGKPPVLRAWDMRAEKPLWEQLAGQSWLEDLEHEQLSIIGRNVYVANKRQLLCLDLANGNKRWQASLSDTPASGRNGLGIADPFPPGGRGAILVPTIDHFLYAFDRDSGQQLWQRSFGENAVEVEAVVGLGACIARHGGSYTKLDVINPAYPASIAAHGNEDWSTDLGRGRVSGRTVLTIGSSMGPESDVEGLFCFDAVTGQVHFVDPVDDLESDVSPIAIGPRAFAAVDSGKGLYVGPRGRPMPPPVPNHKIVALMQAGPALVLLLTKAHGTAVRRIVGLDPQTLGMRFDAGECGSEPDDDFDQQMVTDGYSLVYVASPQDSMESAELRSIDTSTGRRLWSRPAPNWRRHDFVGRSLVLRLDERIEVLTPQNGQVVATIA